ncbi:MAG: CHAD domain-containing protein, partial [Candidatus Binataceae bacterium]
MTPAAGRFRARPVVLSPYDPVGRAAKAVIGFHLQTLTREHTLASAGEVEPIHQMRVATRRLRAALRLFGRLIPAKSAAAAHRDLSWLAQSIGAVRDLDVLAELMATRARKLPPDLANGLAPIEQAMQDRRLAGQGRLEQILESARYRRLLIRLSSISPRGPQSEVALGSVARDFLRPLVSSVQRTGRKLNANSPPELLHRLRVRVKRFRYALETVRTLGGKSSKKTLARLEELQDLLGQHHDATAAITWLRQYADTVPAAPATLLAAGALTHAIERRAGKLQRLSLKAW